VRAGNGSVEFSLFGVTGRKELLAVVAVAGLRSRCPPVVYVVVVVWVIGEESLSVMAGGLWPAILSGSACSYSVV